MLGKYEMNKIMCLDSYEAIKSIPDKSIDLIVTDPPYDIETEGGNTEIGKSFLNCATQLKDVDEGIDEQILDQFMRVMKKPNIYIWCNKKQVPLYLNYFIEKECVFDILVWIKTNPTPLCGGVYLPDKEFCLYFRKGIKLNTTFDSAKTYWITKKECK